MICSTDQIQESAPQDILGPVTVQRILSAGPARTRGGTGIELRQPTPFARQVWVRPLLPVTDDELRLYPCLSVKGTQIGYLLSSEKRLEFRR